MDCRVKPGNDDGGCVDLTRIRSNPARIDPTDSIRYSTRYTTRDVCGADFGVQSTVDRTSSRHRAGATTTPVPRAAIADEVHAVRLHPQRPQGVSGRGADGAGGRAGRRA